MQPESKFTKELNHAATGDLKSCRRGVKRGS